MEKDRNTFFVIIIITVDSPFFIVGCPPLARLLFIFEFLFFFNLIFKNRNSRNWKKKYCNQFRVYLVRLVLGRGKREIYKGKLFVQLRRHVNNRCNHIMNFLSKWYFLSTGYHD